MNKSWWESLTKHEQNIIVAAANEEDGLTMAETNANNGAYLNRLINDHGVQLREFSDEIYEAFGEASAEVIEEARQYDDLSTRIYDSVLQKRDEIGAWTALSDMAYVQKRNQVLGQ